MTQLHDCESYDEEVCLIWWCLKQVWEGRQHCLKYGCGRDTLAYHVWRETGQRIPKNYIRRVLMMGVNLGIATKSQSISGHSIFLLKD